MRLYYRYEKNSNEGNTMENITAKTKPLLTHYFLCSDCGKKNLTETEAGACCQGVAEEFTWDEEAGDWYIVPFSDFKRWSQ